MNDDTFRVWIGCLACYNEGRLVGQWYPASEAGEITTKALHAADGIEVDHAGYLPGRDAWFGPHEELWVFDTDCAPRGYSREMDPLVAQSVAEWLDELDEHTREPFLAYCDHMGYDLMEIDPADVMDNYCGEWEDEKDYAYHLADELGAIPSDYSWPASYIDWDTATRDLFMDYTAIRSPNGIYVFRD